MDSGREASICDGSVERLNNLISEGLPQHLAFAVLKGEMTEAEARDERDRNARAYKLCKVSGSKWPAIDVTWDISPEHFHWALDGLKPGDFKLEYPTVEVAGVDIEDLHGKLLPGSQRIKPPFSAPYRSKSARLVVHLERQGTVTPPFVRVVQTGLCIAGGNHRFGWARHRKQGKIPILIVSAEKPAIHRALSSLSGWP